MQDAVRTYLEVAMGLTDASRKRVRKVVKEAVGRGNATAGQMKSLTNDLLVSNVANREALAKLVRFEVDRALGVVGLATAEEVTELTDRVRDLENQLREAERNGSVSTAPPAAAPVRRARRSAVTPAADSAAPATTAGASTSVAKKATAKKTVAGKTVARKTVAKKALAKKTVAKKAVAKKAPAEQATATGTGA
jgi:polyhydroxyalkanoate synthesis regulator phasin